MKYFALISLIVVLLIDSGCKATKSINKAIAPKEINLSGENKSREDSIRLVNEAIGKLKANYIDFKTFNAKIKVKFSDSKGKNQDVTAVVRIIKDSAIWMSLTATLFNVEAFRVLIKKDSVILVNKLDKEVQYRSLDYLQEVTNIPFDYKTVENLIIGNPVFFNDSINSFRLFDNNILMSSVGEYFKNLLTLTRDTKLMMHSKMDDVDPLRNRTADITYDGYENFNDKFFSTNREIIASETNRVDIRLNFKSYEFNKELSVAFNVPKNYKRK